jgi:Protein of unknown function (DUF1186)/SEC-C motif
MENGSAEAIAMDATEILDQFTHSEGLPTEALEAAGAQRAEMLPRFLAAAEDYLSREPAARTQPTPLFFIFHLLGEWRERTAYRSLSALLRCPEAEAVLGDAITTTCHRVVASVFDGDPQPLYDIILDPDADEFVRAAMFETLAMVTLRGELDRGVAARFLRDAYNDLRPQRESYVWAGWESAIALLGLAELKVLVKRAFDRRFIDPQILSFDEFEKDLRRGIAQTGHPWHPHDRYYELFGETVEELSGWCYLPENNQGGEEWQDEGELDWLLSEPYQNPLRGVGRNDPCPCGSGKKFKKCCLT